MLFYSKEDTAWILSRAVPFKETKTLLSIKLILSFIFGIPGKDHLLTARCIRVRMIPLCLQLLTAIALAVIRIGTDYFAIAAMRSNLLGKFLLLPAKEHLRQAQLDPNVLHQWSRRLFCGTSWYHRSRGFWDKLIQIWWSWKCEPRWLLCGSRCFGQEIGQWNRTLHAYFAKKMNIRRFRHQRLLQSTPSSPLLESTSESASSPPRVLHRLRLRFITGTLKMGLWWDLSWFPASVDATFEVWESR